MTSGSAEQMPAVRLGAGGLADVTISYAAARLSRS